MKVLVVDDSMVMRNIHKNILKDHGIEADSLLEAGDGQTAYDIAAHDSIDLFILDWDMPKMSGLDFVLALRKNAA